MKVDEVRYDALIHQAMADVLCRALVHGTAYLRVRVEENEQVSFAVMYEGEAEGLHAEPVGDSGSTPDDATAGPPNPEADVPLRRARGEEGRR